MRKYDIEQDLLYRDGLILIINKPSGIPVHAGPKGGDNLEMYFDQLQFGLPRKPNLAHRLDRDTSGCLVLGRHSKALAKMGKLFSSGQVEKTYWAVVEGHLDQPSGVIDLPLKKKSEDKRSWWMQTCEKDDPDAMESVTEYVVKGTTDKHTWLEMYPKTGRTHQLRVHCQALGCPIVGDALYGKDTERGSVIPTLHLHAENIKVPLYKNKETIDIHAPPPPHMLPLLRACGYHQ